MTKQNKAKRKLRHTHFAFAVCSAFENHTRERDVALHKTLTLLLASKTTAETHNKHDYRKTQPHRDCKAVMAGNRYVGTFTPYSVDDCSGSWRDDEPRRYPRAGEANVSSKQG
ncbi:hypothetical protein CCR75_004059 [Bremia lactucae]|uniref:Uncharacterized protein n=1 Tax=Bremia lactucae TaxID=4779 RepID=A0A976FFK1_BRELC|nr:hypothetical protein CCR75_004059 [Bremia lactucae]